jgi:hypothetical protein
MDNPTALSEKTLPELKQLLDDFPCFHALQMLYLKNMALVGDLRLQADLKKIAIHVPDRLKLCLLLESDPHDRLEMPEPQQKTERFGLVEKFLEETGVGDEPLSEVSPVFNPSSATDYTHWLLNHKQPDHPDAKLQGQDLIDSFLENDAERQRQRNTMFQPLAAENTGNDTPTVQPDDLEPVSATNSYFTETLAHIYIKQKRYRKALEIITGLSLKYPEKSIYFAGQIRFIEKLIIHTKA